MAYIETTKTIPGEFLRTDDTLTNADRFLSVRDRQLFLKNYNILLARRSRQVVMSQTFKDKDNVTTGPTQITNLDEAFGTTSAPILRVPIVVPPTTKTMTMKVYANTTTVETPNESVYLWPIVSSPEFSTTPTTSTSSAQVNTAADTTRGDLFSVTFDVRPPADGLCEFLLYAACEAHGGATKGGGDANVTGAGANWVDVDDSTGNVGDMIYFTSSPDDEVIPRIVVDEYVNAGTARYTVNKPWGPRWPQVGATCNWQAVAPLKLFSLCLFANAPTNFDSESEPA